MPVFTGILGDPVTEEGAVVGRANDLAGQVTVDTGAARGIGALAAMRPAAPTAGRWRGIRCPARCGVIPGRFA